jgi:hypothetical protein
MKVIKIILTIQSLIIIAGLFYLTQKAFRVEGYLKLLKTQVSSLEEEINSVGSQADDLDGEVSSIKSNVDNIDKNKFNTSFYQNFTTNAKGELTYDNDTWKQIDERNTANQKIDESNK